MVSSLKSYYDSVRKEERGNVLVPESAEDVDSVYYNEYTCKYDVGYKWQTDDTVPSTRKMKIMRAGEQFDRLGAPTGRCIGVVNKDGSCANREQRSIPYHFTEKDITKEPSYHRYEAEKDITRSSLLESIDESYEFNDDEKKKIKGMVEYYYKKAPEKYGEGEGLQYGEIAPMFEKTTGSTGGGYQYDMPLDMETLEKLGVITEIN